MQCSVKPVVVKTVLLFTAQLSLESNLLNIVYSEKIFVIPRDPQVSRQMLASINMFSGASLAATSLSVTH